MQVRLLSRGQPPAVQVVARVSQKQQAAYLAAQDPVLGEVIARVRLRPLRRAADPGGTGASGYFRTLVTSIVGQQISLQAAASIMRRVLERFGEHPTPAQLLAAPVPELRALGLSESKARYLKDLAAHVADGRLDLVHVASLPDEEVMRELVAVKGIGPWTAEMFLMFSLRRPDVFSYGDMGLVNAMVRLYRLRKPVSRARMERIAKRWAPYRTLAARYLWASLGEADTWG